MDVLEAIFRRRGADPGARPGADHTMVVTGYLLTPPNYQSLCTVSVQGSAPIHGVPAVPGYWVGVTAARILMQDGRPIQVLSPAGQLPIGTGIPTPPGEDTISTVTGSRAVAAQTSGTWRAARRAWDAWGDPTDTYQAGTSTSGPLTGVAMYGDHLVALGASKITAATLSLVQSPSGNATPWTAIVQGCSNGALPEDRAPTLSGATALLSMPGSHHAGAAVSVDLPAEMLNGFHAGSIRGLGLVGDTYGAVLGPGRQGQAWVLTITYEITG